MRLLRQRQLAGFTVQGQMPPHSDPKKDQRIIKTMPPAAQAATPPKGILKKSDSSSSKGMSVTFSGKKHIKKIPHINTMSEEEIEQIWYSHYDYDDIKASFEYTVFMMDAGEARTVENDDHTCRGLEMRTEEGAWSRFEHKRDAYNAVLDEQDRQWNDGEEDADQIAACCLEVTESAYKGAVERGMKDQHDIEDYIADMREQLKNGLNIFSDIAPAPSPCSTDAPVRTKQRSQNENVLGDADAPVGS